MNIRYELQGWTTLMESGPLTYGPEDPIAAIQPVAEPADNGTQAATSVLSR